MHKPVMGRSLRDKVRPLLLLAAGIATLGAPLVHAMEPGGDEGRQEREERGRERAPARPEARREERPASAPPAAPQGAARDAARGREPYAAPPRGPQSPEQRAVAPPAAPQGTAREGALGRESFAAPQRGPQGPEQRGVVPPPRPSALNRPPPAERVVPRLPSGARQYDWAGSPYYHSGGHWYRPYGSSFVIVAAPFGLFVPYLPAYYTSFWFGGTRYFLADDTYYVFDDARNGYVVAQSPYGDDQGEDVGVGSGPGPGSEPGQELFIYPMHGQSERQQADDRYECHRWAVDQSHYDPTNAAQRGGDRVQYDRAMTACLTGRGYSVK